MNPVSGLILDGGIPPTIIVNNMIRPRKRDAQTASLKTAQSYGIISLVETIN